MSNRSVSLGKRVLMTRRARSNRPAAETLSRCCWDLCRVTYKAVSSLSTDCLLQAPKHCILTHEQVHRQFLTMAVPALVSLASSKCTFQVQDLCGNQPTSYSAIDRDFPIPSVLIAELCEQWEEKVK